MAVDPSSISITTTNSSSTITFRAIANETWVALGSSPYSSTWGVQFEEEEDRLFWNEQRETDSLLMYLFRTGVLLHKNPVFDSAPVPVEFSTQPLTINLKQDGTDLGSRWYATPSAGTSIGLGDPVYVTYDGNSIGYASGGGGGGSYSMGMVTSVNTSYDSYSNQVILDVEAELDK